jgi:integrase
MEARQVEEAGDRNSVWAVLNAYVNDLQNRVANGDAAQNTLNFHLKMILPFNAECGTMPVRRLRPQHVTDWLTKMRQERWSEKLRRATKWTDSTVQKAREVLRRAFRWAADEAGIIGRSPFDRARGRRQKHRRRRPAASRVAITDHEHELLLAQAMKRKDKGFAQLLTCWYRTGARPAEMYGATAAEWDEARKAFVIKAAPENHGRFKLAHLGEDRVLYIPNDLVPLVKDLMRQHPAGPIFRTESGAPWSNEKLCARFHSIKEAVNKKADVPIRKAVTSYSYRHRYVTRWIEQDRPIWKLCELLNTSEAMLRQHYSHLFERTSSLREALDDFDRGTAGQPASATATEARPEG